MFAQKTSVSRIGPQKFDDGIVRHDGSRLYFESTIDDGNYVSPNAGEVLNLQAYSSSSVHDYDIEAKHNTVVIRALPEYSLVRLAQKQDAKPQVLTGNLVEIFA